MCDFNYYEFNCQELVGGPCCLRKVQPKMDKNLQLFYL
jgi:hypothetical protein